MLRRGLLAAIGLGGSLGLAGCVQVPTTPQQVVSAVPVRPACDTSFTVVNNSSATVRELYFSHSSLSGWGNDQLGRNMLPPGRALSYRAANTGNYDFRVVWTNGRTAQLMRVNVCAASRITVTNSGLYAS
jgi:hypothetical protein